MRISIVSTVECFAAHFARKRLYTGVDANVLLVVLGIHKGCITRVTLVGAFTSVCRFDVVFQQTSSFE